MQSEQPEDEDWSGLISPENLTKQISLDSYVEDELSELYGDNLPSHVAESRMRTEAFVEKLRSRTQPGDSWWQWIQGPEPMMQTGGVALVRNGTIVWAKMTWIS